MGASRHEVQIAEWTGTDGVENQRPPDAVRTVVEWQLNGVRITNPDHIAILDEWYRIETGAEE